MADDGDIERDAGGIITTWSAEAEQLFGWSLRAAIGMRPIDQRALAAAVEQ